MVINSKLSKTTAKEPVQERSKETKRKIVEAANELFAEIGFDSTTTTLIAQRAEMSIGGLYRHFENKKEVFYTILDNHCEEMYSHLKKYIDTIIEKDQGLKDAIEWLIPALFEAHSKNGDLSFEMIKFAIMDKKAGEIESYWRNKENEEIQRLIAHYGNKIRVVNKNTAAILIHFATLEIFRYIYAYANSGKVDTEELLQEFMEMLKNSFIK